MYVQRSCSCCKISSNYILFTSCEIILRNNLSAIDSKRAAEYLGGQASTNGSATSV